LHYARLEDPVALAKNAEDPNLTVEDAQRTRSIPTRVRVLILTSRLKDNGLEQDSPAVLLIAMILALFGADVGLYVLSFTVPDMVGASVFIIILFSYAIWRTQKRAVP
jgi:hypothetical protein